VPKEPMWKTLQRIADRAAPKMQQAFLKAAASAQTKTKMTALTDAIRKGDFAKAWQALDWERTVNAELTPELQQALLGIVKTAGIETMTDLIQGTPSFELMEAPQSVYDYVNKRTGELITNINRDTLMGVRDAVREAFLMGKGLPARQIFTTLENAANIKESLGLNAKQMKALNKYRATLKQQGVSQQAYQKMTDRYKTTLLKQRANTIARTETIQAACEGQRQIWEQAADDGSIDAKRWEVEWLVTPDDITCKHCMTMRNKRRPIKGVYTAGFFAGKKGPAAHPNCRCSERLVAKKGIKFPMQGAPVMNQAAAEEAYAAASAGGTEMTTPMYNEEEMAIRSAYEYETASELGLATPEGGWQSLDVSTFAQTPDSVNLAFTQTKLQLSKTRRDLRKIDKAMKADPTNYTLKGQWADLSVKKVQLLKEFNQYKQKYPGVKLLSSQEAKAVANKLISPEAEAKLAAMAPPGYGIKGQPVIAPAAPTPAAVTQVPDKPTMLPNTPKEGMFEANKSVTWAKGDSQGAGYVLNGTNLQEEQYGFWKQESDVDLIGEPKVPPVTKQGQKVSTGAVVVEPDGRIWVVEPTGHYGGYENTFPKGGWTDKNLSLQQNAMKEVFEELGIKIKITGYLGDFEGQTSNTRYYLAQRTGGAPWVPGKESQAVKLMTVDDAQGALNVKRDQDILAKVKTIMGKGEVYTIPPKPQSMTPEDYLYTKNQVEMLNRDLANRELTLEAKATALHDLEHYQKEIAGYAAKDAEAAAKTIAEAQVQTQEAIAKTLAQQAAVAVPTPSIIPAKIGPPVQGTVNLPSYIEGSGKISPGQILKAKKALAGKTVTLKPFVQDVIKPGMSIAQAEKTASLSRRGIRKFNKELSILEHAGMDVTEGKIVLKEMKIFHQELLKQLKTYSATNGNVVGMLKPPGLPSIVKISGIPKSVPTQVYSAPVAKTPLYATKVSVAPGEQLQAEKMVKIGGQKGSNPGGSYRDNQGQEWYIKQPKSESHAKNEVLAGKLYELAGVDVPQMELAQINGVTGVASRMVAGVSQVGAAEIGKLVGTYEGFATDAWLANWDVVGLGYDNLLAKAGQAIRVDTGGSLLYRAQGTLKGSAFTSDVKELESLRNSYKNAQSAKVFENMTKEKLVASMEKVANIVRTDIEKMVMLYGPGTAAERGELANKLLSRQTDIRKKMDVLKQEIADEQRMAAIPKTPMMPNPLKTKMYSSRQQFLNTLPRNEADSLVSFIKDFTGSGYTTIREFQKYRDKVMQQWEKYYDRSHATRMAAEYDKNISNYTKMINSTKTHEGQVWRGLRSVQKSAAKANYREGQTIEWTQLTSSSTSESKAQGFGDHVLFRIQTKNNGQFIGDISYYGREQEVMLRNNTKYRVMKVTDGYQGKWLLIDLQEANDLEQASYRYLVSKTGKQALSELAQTELLLKQDLQDAMYAGQFSKAASIRNQLGSIKIQRRQIANMESTRTIVDEAPKLIKTEVSLKGVPKRVIKDYDENVQRFKTAEKDYLKLKAKYDQFKGWDVKEDMQMARERMQYTRRDIQTAEADYPELRSYGAARLAAKKPVVGPKIVSTAPAVPVPINKPVPGVVDFMNKMPSDHATSFKKFMQEYTAQSFKQYREFQVNPGPQLKAWTKVFGAEKAQQLELEMRRNFEYLDQAFQKVKLTPGELWRGISTPFSKVKDVYTEGNVVRWDQITSTSAKEGEASVFIENSQGNDTGFLFKIKTHTGGLDVNKVSLSKGQQEFLLPQGLSFRVTRVTREEGITTVELEETSASVSASVVKQLKPTTHPGVKVVPAKKVPKEYKELAGYAKNEVSGREVSVGVQKPTELAKLPKAEGPSTVRPAVLKSDWKDTATLAKAKEQTASMFPKMELNIEGMETHVANKVMKQMSSISNDIPELKQFVKGMSNGWPPPAGVKQTAMCAAGPGGEIWVNPRVFNSIQGEKEIKVAAQNNWSVARNQQEAITHEVGHLVADMLSRDPSMRAALEEFMNTAPGRSKLSMYAVWDKKEAFAEGFVRMYQGGNGPYEKALKRFLSKATGRKFI